MRHKTEPTHLNSGGVGQADRPLRLPGGGAGCAARGKKEGQQINTGDSHRGKIGGGMFDKVAIWWFR